MNDFDDIYRKINIRKEAENNRNYSDGNNLEESSKKISLEALEDKVIIINSLWNVNYDFEIHSHRKVLGRVIIFSKKVVRKLLKWYVKDTGIKQNTFNSYSVQVINGMWEYINELNRENQNLENNLSNLKNTISSFEEKLDVATCSFEEKLKDTTSSFNKKLEDTTCLFKENLNASTCSFEEKLEDTISLFNKKLDDTINNANNKTIKFNEDISYLKYRIKCLNDKKVDIKLDENNYVNVENTRQEDNNLNDEIDYFDFENKFRGSEIDTQKRQEVYLPYFKNTNKLVLDIGCGRGEFLTMLSQNNILCKGVDIYTHFVKYCKYKGLDVELGDAISLLNKLEDNSLGGVFIGQVAEHLETNYLIKLLNLCRDKICVGGKLIVETPNPETISILGDTFYVDPSHIKPIHPLQLKYIAESAGFKNIETLYLHEFEEKIPYPIGIENSVEINGSIDKINKLLYGPRDYSIIAEK